MLTAWLQRFESPVTTYYLLLGATAVLVVIGLIMVLSASAIVSCGRTDSSYTVFLRPAAVRGRRRHRALRSPGSRSPGGSRSRCPHSSGPWACSCWSSPRSARTSTATATGSPWARSGPALRVRQDRPGPVRRDGPDPQAQASSGSSSTPSCPSSCPSRPAFGLVLVLGGTTSAPSSSCVRSSAACSSPRACRTASSHGGRSRLRAARGGHGPHQRQPHGPHLHVLAGPGPTPTARPSRPSTASTPSPTAAGGASASAPAARSGSGSRRRTTTSSSPSSARSSGCPARSWCWRCSPSWRWPATGSSRAPTTSSSGSPRAGSWPGSSCRP